MAKVWSHLSIINGDYFAKHNQTQHKSYYKERVASDDLFASIHYDLAQIKILIFFIDIINKENQNYILCETILPDITFPSVARFWYNVSKE